MNFSIYFDQPRDSLWLLYLGSSSLHEVVDSIPELMTKQDRGLRNGIITRQNEI